jgi:hypothetical protein
MMADKKQIGLTVDGGAALAELMEAKLFNTEMDAYRCGITYALGMGLDPESAPDGGYQTKFNAAGGLDTYQEIRDLIVVLRPNEADRPYATAERLAELGITEMATRVAAHENLSEVLADLDVTPDVDDSPTEPVEDVDLADEG